MAKKGEKFKIPEVADIEPVIIPAPEPHVPIPHKRLVRPRYCQEFLDYWNPRVRVMYDCVELDYSYAHKGISITDMRIPSALRLAPLYSQDEVNDSVDLIEGDFQRRVDKFLNSGPGNR